jgi:hypothetical protein
MPLQKVSLLRQVAGPVSLVLQVLAGERSLCRLRQQVSSSDTSGDWQRALAVLAVDDERRQMRSLRAPRPASEPRPPANLDIAGTEQVRRAALSSAGGETSSMNVFFTMKPKLSRASAWEACAARTCEYAIACRLAHGN